MKKLIALLLSIVMILSMAACGPTTPADGDTTGGDTNGTTTETTEGAPAGVLGEVRKGCLCGAKEHLGDCDGKEIDWYGWDLAANNNSLPTASGYYYLTADGKSAPVGINTAEVHIDLNGKSVQMEGNTHGIFVQDNAKLYISDSVGTGKLIASTDTAVWDGGLIRNGVASSFLYIFGGTLDGNGHTANFGGTLYQWSGTVNMYGGTIIGAKAQKAGGGAVFMEDGTAVFNMYGGEITGGTADNSVTYGNDYDARCGGGNVNVFGETTTFNMFGGKITKGTSPKGGNVIVNGVFNMTGGEITEGHLTTSNPHGGGLFLNNATNSALNVSGEVRITGNTAEDNGKGETKNDVCLPKGKIVNILDGGLSGNAVIGLRGMAVGQQFTSTNVTADDLKYFDYFTTRYNVIFDAENSWITIEAAS